ncbi:hypothetical protein DM860_013588 [Cuscuta australis]|uniref:Uncharacterized protein n=1 Tax=Cuscuta australis TaxID=267555 RepID=A0A328EAM3_9ASTE|nr:hypothetical protein DM860_013588 [Cuscuta australis]
MFKQNEIRIYVEDMIITYDGVIVDFGVARVVGGNGEGDERGAGDAEKELNLGGAAAEDGGRGRIGASSKTSSWPATGGGRSPYCRPGTSPPVWGLPAPSPARLPGRDSGKVSASRTLSINSFSERERERGKRGME